MKLHRWILPVAGQLIRAEAKTQNNWTMVLCHADVPSDFIALRYHRPIAILSLEMA